MLKFANYNFYLFLIEANGVLDNKGHFCQKDHIDYPIKKGFIKKKLTWLRERLQRKYNEL